MSATAATESWSVGRWFAAIAGLAVLAGSSAQFLTRWPQLPAATEISHPDYLFDPRTDGPAATDEMLPDPMVFAAPDRRGFSGTAERLRPGLGYSVARSKSNPIGWPWIAPPNALAHPRRWHRFVPVRSDCRCPWCRSVPLPPR